MDITELSKELEREEDAIVLPIFHKNGEQYLASDGGPCTISVVGADSKRVQGAERKNTNRAINRGRGRLTPEQLNQNRVNLAAAAIVAWHGWVDGDKPFDCTMENALRMLKLAPHILRQVEEGVASHADFSETRSEN